MFSSSIDDSRWKVPLNQLVTHSSFMFLIVHESPALTSRTGCCILESVCVWYWFRNRICICDAGYLETMYLKMFHYITSNSNDLLHAPYYRCLVCGVWGGGKEKGRPFIHFIVAIMIIIMISKIMNNKWVTVRIDTLYVFYQKEKDMKWRLIR